MNIKWNIGNGKFVSIDEDWWCGKDSLVNRNLLTSEPDINYNVDCIINDNGGQDESKISTLLPNIVHREVLNVPLPMDLSKEDKHSWLGKGSRKFSVGPCYNCVLEDNGSSTTNSINWNWLWKLKLPHKIIHFLWLLWQDKILSRVKCVVRGMLMTQTAKFVMILKVHSYF